MEGRRRRVLGVRAAAVLVLASSAAGRTAEERAELCRTAGGEPGASPWYGAVAGGLGAKGVQSPCTLTVTVDGAEHSANLWVPDSYVHDAGAKAPVVFRLHAHFNVTRYADYPRALNMDPIDAPHNVWEQIQDNLAGAADEHAFLAVWPQRPMNASAPGLPVNPSVTDTLVTGKLLDMLETNLHVDPERVYVIGMSYGGLSTMWHACNLADRVAAVASVAGPMGDYVGLEQPSSLEFSTCSPGRAMPYLHIHATGDETVPYDGKYTDPATGALVGSRASVREVSEWWAAQNEAGDLSAVTYSATDVSCVSTPSSVGNTSLCTLTGGSHVWPGATINALLSWTDVAGFKATDHIVQFVLGFTRTSDGTYDPYKVYGNGSAPTAADPTVEEDSPGAKPSIAAAVASLVALAAALP